MPGPESVPGPEGRRGRLVAVCGIDGSGKATQTGLLADRARADGWDVKRISFPRYGQGFFADIVQSYLRGEYARDPALVPAQLASLPFALDRWQAAPEIREWLDGGALVLCDRYVPANMAHQGSKIDHPQRRQEFFDWVARLEYEELAVPRADLHVLLDMPGEMSARLLDKRTSRETPGTRQLMLPLFDGHDIHENDVEYLRETGAVYRQISHWSHDRWVVITCVKGGKLRAPDEIADEVWAEVSALLYNHKG